MIDKDEVEVCGSCYRAGCLTGQGVMCGAPAAAKVVSRSVMLKHGLEPAARLGAKCQHKHRSTNTSDEPVCADCLVKL